METVDITTKNSVIIAQILETMHEVSKLTENSQKECIDKEAKAFKSVDSFKHQLDVIIEKCTRAKELTNYVESNMIQSQHKVTKKTLKNKRKLSTLDFPQMKTPL